MNVFVTGGAGYIGSIVSSVLLQDGHDVTVYDSLVTGHQAAVPAGARFIHADIGDQDALEGALTSAPFDALMHFAGYIEAGESMKKPGKFFENNVVNSIRLIESAHQAGIGRIVFSSTAAVYRASDALLDEDAPIGPTNTYGETKLMIEQTLSWYCQVHNLRYAALRYFNAAGGLPDRGEAHQPESHLIPLVLKVALGQRPKILIYGSDYPTPDGSCIRDYIHVSDLASAHTLALEALNDHSRLVYNLGNGAGYSVKEVIETARKVTGHPIPAVDAPRRPGDSARLVASSERIRSELGWKPQIPDLEKIIASAWEWHNSHPNGYLD
jgi:UDP-glucose 4-epimerase